MVVDNIKKYMLKYKFQLIKTIILGILNSLSFVLISLILKEITDTALSKDGERFTFVVIVSLILFILVGVINYLFYYTKTGYIKNIMVSLRGDVFKNISKKSYADFYGNSIGSYISNLINDLTLLENNYVTSIVDIVGEVVLFSCTIGVLININPIITIILLTISILMVIVPIIFGKKLNVLQINLSKALEVFTQKIKELLQGYEVINSFNLQKEIIYEFKDKNINYENSKLKYRRILFLSQSVSVSLSIICQLIAISIGGYFLMNDKISTGSLIAIIQLGTGILGPIQSIISHYTTIKSSKKIKEKIISLTNPVKPFNENNNKQKISRFNESIEIKNLNFGYNDSNLVIKDFSYVFQKNKKYLIIGESGCGKSTILKILLGYYTSYSGEILIDGVDYKTLDMSSINSVISLIDQNTYLFEKSIEENIKLNMKLDSKRYERLLKESKVDSFLPVLDSGLQYVLKDNGINLSGGQKQRISIARALAKNAPILIADEITSALDNKAAIEIENSILLFKDSTLISVSHKRNSDIMKKYDKILLMKAGSLVAEGSLDEISEYVNGKDVFEKG